MRTVHNNKWTKHCRRIKHLRQSGIFELSELWQSLLGTWEWNFRLFAQLVVRSFAFPILLHCQLLELRDENCKESIQYAHFSLEIWPELFVGVHLALMVQFFTCKPLQYLFQRTDNVFFFLIICNFCRMKWVSTNKYV